MEGQNISEINLQEVDIQDLECNIVGKTEQDYLDLAKDCMERIRIKNKEIQSIKKILHQNKLQLTEVYGCYRKLLKYVGQLSSIDTTIDFLMREIEIDLQSMIFTRPEINIDLNINFEVDNEEDDNNEDIY